MLTYEKWLNSIFGSSVKRVTEPSWQIDSKTLVELIYITLLRSGSDLLRFSDKQVNNGLNLIFNNSYSDIVFALKDPTVAFEARAEAVRAIKVLYSDCFEKRAWPALSHLDERGSPLNQICYMLWDVTPIGAWGHVAGCEYFPLTLEVLEFALYLRNPACVESALHGLGHVGKGSDQRIHTIIKNWAERSVIVRRELLTYAEYADKGQVL
jgi:hypothetical protein